MAKSLYLLLSNLGISFLLLKDYVCLPPNLPWKSCQSQKSEDSKGKVLKVLLTPPG